MPAKKKQPSDRETMLLLAEALTLVTQVAREQKEKLAGSERERSVFEASIRELAAEAEWWRGEAANLRSELLALIRDEARRAKPVADES